MAAEELLMRGYRCGLKSSMSGLVACMVFATAACSTQVRVATYNIQFLSTDVVNGMFWKTFQRSPCAGALLHALFRGPFSSPAM
jgi:hypothetical protein